MPRQGPKRTLAIHRPSATRGAAALAIAAAIAAAVLVRVWNLRDQVLGGDELHAVATALGRSLGWILTNYAVADHSMPQSAAIHAWLAAGGSITETGLRVPALVCGVALVVLGALTMARAIDPAAGARFAWLLAFAPALVLYSRILRSYAPMALLAIGAAIAGWRWIETSSTRSAAAYVALAAAAIWFHLGAAPFVCAPLAFALALRVTRGRAPASAPSLDVIAATAFVLVLACSLFFLPALPSLLQLLAIIRQTELPDATTWLAVARLQSGAPDPWLATLAFGLAALGLAWLVRARPRLAAYSLTLVGAQITGLLLLRPDYFEHAFILNRYLLPCIVVLNAWIALGLGALAPARPRVAALATAALVATLALRGPLAEPSFRSGSFAHANEAVSFEDRGRLHVDSAWGPRFYHSLASATHPTAIAVLPGHAWWQFSRLFAADQDLHRARVVVAGEVPGLDDPRVAFRNFVWPDPARLAASGAAWAVVHLDLESEQARIRGTPRNDSFDEVPPAVRAGAWETLRVHAARAAARLESAWGPPDVREPGLLAWRIPR